MSLFPHIIYMLLPLHKEVDQKYLPFFLILFLNVQGLNRISCTVAEALIVGI